MQGEMGLGFLVQRQVTPRWANDPMLIHNSGKGKEVRGVRR